MNLIIKPKKGSQEIVSVTPASAGWRYISFSRPQLAPGETLDLLGQLQRALRGRSERHRFRADRGPRLEGDRRTDERFRRRLALCRLSPASGQTHHTAKTDAEIGVAGGPAKGELPARLIEPAAMRRSVRGKGSNTRYVCDILPQDEPAESVLVVEVRTPSGNSSSYPPHKHDIDNIPKESLLEETYYHRINPPQGFVFQRVYSDSRDLDESIAVEDRDVVLVPRGYHPVVVPHGYESYYFNVMAGPKRVWHFHNDPAHEWILSAA